MEEPKFRGKSKSTGEFVYGFLTTDAYRHRRFIERVVGNTLYTDEVYPETVGITTGLKDDNNRGIEIFENDIIYLSGYGNYLCEFPFIELYEALNESDIGKVLGNATFNKELMAEFE